MAGFLDLPERCSKPRDRGLTHVLDKGLSCAEAEGLLEVSGPSVDLVKLGWGTALVTANLEPKLRCYARAEVPVVLGGTLTEILVAMAFSIIAPATGFRAPHGLWLSAPASAKALFTTAP